MALLAMFALAVLLPDGVHGFLEQRHQSTSSNTSAAFASDMTAFLCNSGTELATALASATVQIAYVPADIVMTDADWANYKTPLTLWRNITISGTSSDGNKWPLLDLSFTLNKVKLGSGVMLRFQHIAIKNWRKGAYFQAPGLDLVATNPDTVAPETQAGLEAPLAPAPGLVMFDTMAYIQRSCFPPDISSVSTNTLARPPQLPGEQLAARLPADPTCVNDTSAPAMRRCWAARGAYWDMATPGFNFDDAYNPVPAGFNIWYSNTQYKCEVVMAEECLNKLGPVACYYRMFPRVASPPFRVADDGAPADGRGGGGGSSLLAPLLGGFLGGAALTGVVGVVAFLLLRRRQLRQGGGMRSPSSDGAANGPKAAAKLESGDERKAAPDERRCARYLQAPTATPGKGGVPFISDGGAAGGKDLLRNTNLHGSSVISAGTTTMAGGSSSALPLAAQHGGVSMSLLSGPDPYACMHPISSSTVTPVIIGPGGSGGAADAGGSGGGADQGLTPSSAGGGQRLGSQTCVHERGGSSASLSQPRCTVDELALLPVTPLTPLQPEVDLDPSVVGATVKLLPVTLGKGAFGRVVEGQYAGQRVAVKLLNAGLLTGTEELAVLAAMAKGPKDGGDENATAALLRGPGGRAMSSLIREVEVLARCQHPNIVRLLAASLVPPRICLVMELMDTSLDRLMHAGTTSSLLPLPTIIHIAVQIARALSYLHPTVLHRDLKPANVLISQPQSDTPLAKLADFGVSRLQTTIHATKNSDVGTAPYVAPESFDVLNPAMTDRAEIYAFGVILWEMLTGERPWHSASTAQIAFAVTVLNSRLPLGPLSEERCPHKVRALLVSCWERDPDRRPAAAEVVKALVLAQEALVAPSSSAAVGSEGPLDGIKDHHHHLQA